MDEHRVLGGRYRLLRRIAAGGMGTVWEAEDILLHRRVAVKTPSDALAEDPGFVERFRREARAAARLAEPNVAGVYDYGEDAGAQYLVMELLHGETLAKRLYRDGRLPAGEAARIAAGVGAALRAAHDAGLVHRDVKPGNVMLTDRGQVKVMDFGIAAAASGVPLTATGVTIGTADYLSPEQASGGKAVPTSDVYSLGCVLYEMLTGHPPFTGDTPLAVATAHVQDRPVPVRELAREAPPALAAACERALAKDPGERPTASAFVAMLHSGGEPATAVLEPAGVTTTAVGPVGPRASRRGVWLGSVIVVGLLLIAALAFALAGGEAPSSPGLLPRTPTPTPTPTLPVTVPALDGLP